MVELSKNHKTILGILLIFIIGNYITIIGKGFFFPEDEVSRNPINYNVITKDQKQINLKSETDFINLSSEMIDIFEDNNFTVNNFIKKEIDKMIIFSSLPDDFLELQPIALRKDLFIKTVIQLIYIENEKVLNDRAKILQWWTETDGELIERDFWPDWLINISKDYEYEDIHIGDLLMRVDLIPISMALAQSAIESGWGTSRYAREGNAIFGQYTFDTNAGIIPEERKIGKKFLIKKYNNLSDSVASYIKNLNTHNAYEDLRQTRKKLRMDGKNISSKALVSSLKSYSERGEDYIIDLKRILEENNFYKFDKIYFEEDSND